MVQATQVAGSPASLALAPDAATSTIVPTTARPRTQPSRNIGPFTRPRGVPSISTTAMIGIGLSETPTRTRGPVRSRRPSRLCVQPAVPADSSMSASRPASVPRASTITGQCASAVTRRETPPSMTDFAGP